MTLQSARDYLVGKGLAKPGRGKFSAAAHDALAQAIQNGETFSDYPKSDTVVKTDKGTKTVKAAKPNDPGPTPDPWNFGRVYTRVNGKRVYSDGADGGMREVCNHCKVSLFYCVCKPLGRQPTANVNSKLCSVPVWWD